MNFYYQYDTERKGEEMEEAAPFAIPSCKSDQLFCQHGVKRKFFLFV